MAGTALAIRSVSKQFVTPEGGVVHALDDVSLDIEDGSFIVLLGPSGCGKTTLLRCIAGLESPDSGEIALYGERIDDVPVWKRRVNTVFQSYALFPHMTVAQNVAFGLEMDKLSKAEIGPRVDEALAMVRLEGMGGRRPSQLSGGQQQRVALARALAKRPEVLLLDEPLSALDLKLRRGMQTELKRLQRETHITFVLVTHDQDEAMAMGDQVAVFNAGRIAQVGAPRDVYLTPATRFVADFIGEANVLSGTLKAGHIEIAGLAPMSLTLLANGGDAVDGDVLVAVRPENVTIAPGSAGTVRDVTFVGGDLHVDVDLAGTIVTTRMPSHGSAVPRLGDGVDLVFADGSLRLVDA